MVNRSENKIDEILSSLDGISRAEARPFMHTRVMARMQSDDKTIWGRAVSFIARPAIALACLTAVIATNLFFVMNAEQPENEAVTTTNSVSEEFLQNENLLLAVNNLEASE